MYVKENSLQALINVHDMPYRNSTEHSTGNSAKGSTRILIMAGKQL